MNADFVYGIKRLALTIAIVIGVWTNCFAADKTIPALSPLHGLPPPEVKRAVELAKNGDAKGAIELLRSEAKSSMRFRFYIGLLLVEWRKQLILENARPIPPVEWGVDWLRCGTLSKDVSEINLAAAILSELYQSSYTEAKDTNGKIVRIPGPGQSIPLAKCWAEVSDGTALSDECMKKEKNWHKLHSTLQKGVVCPPREPTSHQLKLFPNTKLIE